MAARQHKKLTQKEKAFNAKIKKEMQKEGIIPADKKPLNRKKFIEEAKKEFKECNSMVLDLYVLEALSYMIGHIDRRCKLTLEAVGAAKVMKLAVRLNEFHEKLKSEGRTEYNVLEQYEFVKDILEM